jgi:erythromycin esterase
MKTTLLTRTLAPALCTLLIACGADRDTTGVVTPPPPPPVDTVHTPPLPAGVFALTGISELLPHTDLEPFRAIVGSASFVALGESIHASNGYYQAKFRLIRFLIEEMGFRAVTMETAYLEGRVATDYVASCSGRSIDAVRSLTPVWQDRSVRLMLEWLCDYNRMNPHDPVTFFGFDVQESWTSAPLVRQFVERAAPQEIARAEPLQHCLGATSSGPNTFFVSQQFRDLQAGRGDTIAHETCHRGIDQLDAWIAQNAGALASATSAAAVEEARIALLGLRSFEDALWLPGAGSYQARDRGMAETLLRVHALRTPGKKTVVWAWNWHIARRYEELRTLEPDPHGHAPRLGARAMGSFLHDALGSDYLPVALIGYTVEGMRGVTQPPLPNHPDAVERRLYDVGPNHLLVDLRRPLSDSLLPAGREYRINHALADPYRQFGAIVFLAHSAGMISP